MFCVCLVSTQGNTVSTFTSPTFNLPTDIYILSHQLLQRLTILEIRNDPVLTEMTYIFAPSLCSPATSLCSPSPSLSPSAPSLTPLAPFDSPVFDLEGGEQVPLLEYLVRRGRENSLISDHLSGAEDVQPPDADVVHDLHVNF